MLNDKPIGAPLNRNLGNPVAPGEAVEADLNRLIERRSRQRDADEESELWKESVRRYNDRKQEQLRNECASTTRGRLRVTGPSWSP